MSDMTKEEVLDAALCRSIYLVPELEEAEEDAMATDGVVPRFLQALERTRTDGNNDDFEVEWIIKNFLIGGYSHLIFAAGGKGKSLFVQEMAFCLAAGKPFMGHTPERAFKVLYLDMENGVMDLILRRQAFGFDEIPENLYYVQDFSFGPLNEPKGAADFLEVVDHMGAEVVIVDTISKVTIGSENESNTYQEWQKHFLVPLQSRGVTVVVLDHMGHDEYATHARGSAAKQDNHNIPYQMTVGDPVTIDGVTRQKITFKKTKDRSGLIPDKLYVTRTQGARPVHTLTATYVGGSILIDGEPAADTGGLTQEQLERVVNAYEAGARSTMSRRAFTDHLSENNLQGFRQDLWPAVKTELERLEAGEPSMYSLVEQWA